MNAHASAGEAQTALEASDPAVVERGQEISARRPELRLVHVEPYGRAAWDSLVGREPSFALLQSWGWGELKRTSGWTVHRVAVQRDGEPVAGAQLLFGPTVAGRWRVGYVPRGPVGDWLDQDVAPLLLGELHRLATERRAIFLRVEPSRLVGAGAERALEHAGFRSTSYTNQPRATLIVDLGPDSETRLARMHPKTRYNIRYAARRGVVVRTGDEADLPTFYEMLRATGRRTGLTPRSLEYYRREWRMLDALGRGRLLIATHEGEPIAANLSAAFGPHAAYLHGGSTGRKANLQPNYLLMWEAMRWAKGLGCRTFDLWGIPDEVGVRAARGEDVPTGERTDGLWGVYRFKRGFGGDVHLYAAAHDRVDARVRYALVSALVNTPVLDRIASWKDRLSSTVGGSASRSEHPR